MKNNNPTPKTQGLAPNNQDQTPKTQTLNPKNQDPLSQSPDPRSQTYVDKILNGLINSLAENDNAK